EQDKLERERVKQNQGLEDVTEPETEITPILQHNAAFKTIQILGQVLKNFSGSLRGEPKRKLVEECYGLGLRVLASIFELAEEHIPTLVAAMMEYAKARPNAPTADKMEGFLRRAFFGLMQAIAITL